MSIRRATADDAPVVREIARESWHAAYDDLLGAETVESRVDEWYDLDRLEAGLDAAEHYFLAERDGEVVGFAAASADVDDRPADEATLGAIYVRPDRWGEGIGSELLERVAGSVGDAGAARLSAVVFAENGAGRAFYDRRGFEIEERREEEIAGGTVDSLLVVADVAELRGAEV